MSGGSYDYAFNKVNDFADALDVDGACYPAPPGMRAAFKEHCRLVAQAMRACEWNDSGDGDPEETEFIKAVLCRDAVGAAVVESAQYLRKAAADLISAMDAATPPPPTTPAYDPTSQTSPQPDE